jgi:hypothetical protein
MGWKKDDEVGITFGGLKQAQNEAFRDGIAYSVSRLRALGQEQFADLLEIETAGVTLYNEGDEK